MSVDGELCLARWRVEARRVEDPAIDLKLFVRPIDVRDLLVAGDDVADHLPQMTMPSQFLPIHRTSVAQHALADGRDDLHLATRSLIATRTTIAQTYIIEHRLLCCRFRLLIAARTGRISVSRPSPGVSGVQGRAEVGDQVQFRQCPHGKARIGVAAEQVPAQAYRRANRPLVGSLHAAHRVQSRTRRQLDFQVGLQVIEDRLLERRGDTDRSHALHVAVSANGHQANSRFTRHAAQQRDVDDRLNVGDAVFVMRDAHRPGEYGRGCLYVHLRHSLDGCAIHARTLLDRLPADPANVCLIRLEALGGFAYKTAIDGVAFENDLGHAS